MSNRMEMTFPSLGKNEAFARMVIGAFLVQADPSMGLISEVRTAVSEAVTNAIVHAYPDKLGKIVLKLKIREGNVLEITVRDWGKGIEDIQQAREPLFTTGGEERSGMGFTIMESFMDRVNIRSAVNRGTSVVMRKRIAARISGKR